MLIVDDQAINRKLLASMLTKEGHELHLAANGAEALQVVEEMTPELVLLDIMMPGKDGFEVCQEILARPETSEVPVIFLTALDGSADKAKGLTLGAADYITKPFDRVEVLARVRTHLRLRELSRKLVERNRELTLKQERIEEDLEAASSIQHSLIPRRKLSVPGLEVAWRFQPCDAIGGDIFNIIPLPDDKVGLYLLDVSGHGVPSAMITVSVAQSLGIDYGIVTKSDGGVERAAEPLEVLNALDEEYPTTRFGKFFTITYMLLDLKTGFMRYSSAAHPPPVLLRRSGEVKLLEAGGPVIGMGSFLGFEKDEEQLEPGDRLFLYSDGIVEHGPVEDFFGTERLVETLGEARGAGLDGLCERVLSALVKHDGGAPEDDISFLACELGERPCQGRSLPEEGQHGKP